MAKKQIDLEDAIASQERLDKAGATKVMIEERPVKRQYVADPQKRFGYLNEKGQEVVDSTPMAPPVGYVKQPNMWDIIRERVKVELSMRASERGMETFEEADDFEVGDDYDPRSPYEQDFDPSRKSTKELIAELRSDLKKLQEEKEAKAVKDKEEERKARHIEKQRERVKNKELAVDDKGEFID